MPVRVTLSLSEIKEVLDKIPKAYHLEVYRSLKTNFLSEKATKKDIKILQKEIINYLNHKHTPRILTNKEIDYILEAVTVLPATIEEIAQDNIRQVKEVLKRQLLSLKFSIKDDTIEKIKKYVRKQFLKSVCSPGESVGINSSNSISQKLTQATLNTFHQAGSKTKVSGIDYLLSFFKVSKPTNDNVVIHFKDKNLTYEEIKIISNNLRGISIDNIKMNYEILDSLSEEDKIWYDNYLTTMGNNFVYKGGKFLRIYLNLNRCYQYNIFINDVVKTIEYNTRSSEIKQTVKCVASSTYKGIVDVHVEPEFIKLYVNKLNEQVGNNSMPFHGDIDELSQIFLNVLLPDNFKDMIVKGIKGIEHIGISDSINLIRTFKEVPVTSANDMEKYSKKPYNLKLDDISRLWTIKIHRKYLYFEGITREKYIDLFETAGFKIIDNNLNDINPTLVILLPKKLDVTFYDKEDKKVKSLYETDKEGNIINMRENEIVTNITPVILIEEKIKFIEAQLVNIIDENIKSASKIHSNDLPIFPPLYRHCYYYNATIQGKGIIKELMNNNMVDGTFTYPDNVNSVYENLGIEAARFYLINKYFQTTVANGLNPVNIELLVDFQTGLGILLAINSTGVSKIGNSVLSSCSYEKSMDVFQEGSAFGSLDEIKGISGCIITGSTCRNGTGFSKIEYDESYISDKNNVHDSQPVKNITLETDYLTGPCYSTVPQDLSADFDKPDDADNILLNLPEQGKKSELCLKEKIPDPPRMEIPDFLASELEEDVINLEKEYETNDYKVTDLLDIPEDPGQMESDYF